MILSNINFKDETHSFNSWYNLFILHGAIKKLEWGNGKI
jgi:hypothetical protein